MKPVRGAKGWGTAALEAAEPGMCPYVSPSGLGTLDKALSEPEFDNRSPTRKGRFED